MWKWRETGFHVAGESLCTTCEISCWSDLTRHPSFWVLNSITFPRLEFLWVKLWWNFWKFGWPKRDIHSLKPSHGKFTCTGQKLKISSNKRENLHANEVLSFFNLLQSIGSFKHRCLLPYEREFWTMSCRVSLVAPRRTVTGTPQIPSHCAEELKVSKSLRQHPLLRTVAGNLTN